MGSDLKHPVFKQFSGRKPLDPPPSKIVLDLPLSAQLPSQRRLELDDFLISL